MKNLHPKAFWLFAARGIFSMVVSLFVFIFIVVLNLIGDDVDVNFNNAPMIGIIAAIILIGIPLNIGWSYLVFKAYKYELSEDGFRKEMGVISKKYVTVPYNRIQNVDINRDPFARILGLSELTIQTAGASMMYNPRQTNRMYAEGVLPGIGVKEAEEIREELIKRGKEKSNQGGV